MAVKKEIKYADFVSTGEISLELTGEGKWRFDFERLDGITRADLYKVRNLFNDVIEEQDKGLGADD